jgi:MarR family transcriptional regulator, 2-MHQ and catechol-resistance regulon repressor
LANPHNLYKFAHAKLNLIAVGIEKDIHQVKFVSSRQKAMINLLFTYGWVIERIKNFLAAEDITHQQFNILRILRGSFPQPLSTLQIRERMLDKMSDTSRIVDRLVIKGLVKKSICPTDKRLVDVVITDKGQRLLKKIDAESDYIPEIMSNLSENDAEMLSSLLDKLRGSE